MSASTGADIVNGSVTLAHGALSYLEAGRGHPILLLHGVNGNARSWLPQLQGLSRNYRVIAWNAPGYLDSAPVEGNMTTFARAGLELIEALGCNRVSIVGHSLGGVIAMKMLALEPQRFTHAVLSCTHPGYARPVDDRLMDRYKRRVAELDSMSRHEYGRLRASRMLPENAAPAVIDAIAQAAAGVNKKGLKSAMRALATANLLPDLPNIRVPTLVLTCDHDPVVNLERARPVFEGIPGAHHLRLPGLGHAPYYENPDLFNALLGLFFDSRQLGQTVYRKYKRPIPIC